jgi:hypothetical protein
MATQTTDNTKLSELTVGQFKVIVQTLVEEVVSQAIFELEQELPDPDEGKTMRPEFVEKLQLALDESGEIYTLEEVKHHLGLKS